jgi:hypothetical protein
MKDVVMTKRIKGLSRLRPMAAGNAWNEKYPLIMATM